MEADRWKAVFSLGRNLTTTILENVNYIKREIPGLSLPQDLHRRLEEIAEDLGVLSYQTVGDLAPVEIDLKSGALETAEAARLLTGVLDCLKQEFGPVHELVIALRDAPREGSDAGSAYVLLAESAANIYRAFFLLRREVEALPAVDETCDAPHPERGREDGDSEPGTRGAAFVAYPFSPPPDSEQPYAELCHVPQARVAVAAGFAGRRYPLSLFPGKFWAVRMPAPAFRLPEFGRQESALSERCDVYESISTDQVGAILRSGRNVRILDGPFNTKDDAAEALDDILDYVFS